jgi:transposase
MPGYPISGSSGNQHLRSTLKPGAYVALPSKANLLTAENQKLRRDNERLTDQLRKAEIVIDVQKKVAMLLGLPIAETEVS